MTHIVWDNSWNTDNESIDKQHHDLVDITNNINIDNNDILATVESLIDYSAAHFADEEALMFSSGYTDSEYYTHKAEHNLLKHTLLDFSFLLSYTIGDKKKFRLQVSVFESFVAVWFSSHFLLIDKKFSDWLKTRGGVDTSS